jgi:hypothetical protein
MLIEHDAIKTELLGEDLLIEILVKQLASLNGIEMLVLDAEETSLDDFIVGNVPIWPFRKVHKVHRTASLSASAG